MGAAVMLGSTALPGLAGGFQRAVRPIHHTEAAVCPSGEGDDAMQHGQPRPLSSQRLASLRLPGTAAACR